MRFLIVDNINKYYSFIFGYFSCNIKVRLNLTTFNYTSNYIINKNYTFLSTSLLIIP